MVGLSREWFLAFLSFAGLMICVSLPALAHAGNTVTISPVWAATYHDCGCFTTYSTDYVGVSRYEVGILNYPTSSILDPIVSATLELFPAGSPVYSPGFYLYGDGSLIATIPIEGTRGGFSPINVDVTSFIASRSEPNGPFAGFTLYPMLTTTSPFSSFGLFSIRSPLVVTMVPEPSTAALLVIGCVACLAVAGGSQAAHICRIA